MTEDHSIPLNVREIVRRKAMLYAARVVGWGFFRSSRGYQRAYNGYVAGAYATFLAIREGGRR